MALQPNMNGRTARPAAQSEGRMKFKAIGNYNSKDGLVDCGTGGFIAKATATIASSNKDQYPQLRVEWKMTEVADGNEDNEKYIGAGVTSFVTFFPEAEARKGRMGKEELNVIADKLGEAVQSALDTLNANGINSDDALDEIKEAIDSSDPIPVWVVHETDRRDQKLTRCKVKYDDPGDTSGSLGDAVTEDEETEEEPVQAAPAARGKTTGKSAAAPAKKAAVGKGRR